jgi:hypothetical protein
MDSSGDKLGAKLTAKQKEIMQVQRSLLSKNIVWTPTLAQNLKQQHLITDSMVQQIEVGLVEYICLIGWLLACLPVCTSVRLFACMSGRLAVRLSACLSVRPAVFSARMPVCLFACLSACLSVCTSGSLCVCLCLCLSVCRC